MPTRASQPSAAPQLYPTLDVATAMVMLCSQTKEDPPKTWRQKDLEPRAALANSQVSFHEAICMIPPPRPLTDFWPTRHQQHVPPPRQHEEDPVLPPAPRKQTCSWRAQRAGSAREAGKKEAVGGRASTSKESRWQSMKLGGRGHKRQQQPTLNNTNRTTTKRQLQQCNQV